MSGESTPVEELFRNNSRCRIIELFVDKSDCNDTYRTGDIADVIGSSHETVRKAISPNDITSLTNLGVMDVVDPDTTITHYKQAESSVVEYLKEIQWKEIAELFETRATKNLSRFVLMYGDAKKQYNKTTIRDKTGMSNSGFDNNIELFIGSKLINKIERDGYVYPEYQINLNCEMADQVYTLNELLYGQFVEKQEQLETVQ